MLLLAAREQLRRAALASRQEAAGRQALACRDATMAGYVAALSATGRQVTPPEPPALSVLRGGAVLLV